MRFATSISLLMASLAALGAPASAQTATDVALLRYVQTAPEGAKIRNVVGQAGLVLARPAGQPRARRLRRKRLVARC